MIRSFRHKGLRRFFETGDTAKLPVTNAARVGRILRALEAAEEPEGMDIPGYRFHALQGRRQGDYAVSVTGNWRITFAWDGLDAVGVDMEDYH